MTPVDPSPHRRPSRTRMGKFNARPRSGTLADPPLGKPTPPCPEAYRKPLKPVGRSKL